MKTLKSFIDLARKNHFLESHTQELEELIVLKEQEIALDNQLIESLRVQIQLLEKMVSHV